MFTSNPYVYYNIDGSSKPREILEKENPPPTLYHKSDENVLLNPPTGAHIILIYENQYDLDNAISTYINEGLKRGQTCVHASVSLRNENYLDIFSSQITNYQENLERENLKLVDLAPYYVDAMVGNLESFDKLKKELISIAAQDKNRVNNYIRITGDCAMLLLKNKHIKPCILVEEWCNQNPLKGSYLCPHPRSLLSQFPINAYISKLFHNHDIIIDSNGKLIPEYTQQIK